MSLIVQLADTAAVGGGLGTVMDRLALGYAAHGCRVVRITPGRVRQELATGYGRRLVLPVPDLPVAGQRLAAAGQELRRLVDLLGPDRLEVHGRTALHALGRSGRGPRPPTALVSHGRLDRPLTGWTGAAAALLGHRWDTVADRSNRRLAAAVGTVVCTSSWVAEEYRRAGVSNLAQVPLGVDLDEFRPDRASPWVRETLAPRGESLLVTVSRLSRDKRVDRAVDTVAELVRRGRRVRLLVVGEGPLRGRLERRAAGLPVRFVGRLDDRHRLATILACADVAIAPGPVENFGLAVLEALASGTPVVVDAGSALPEVVGTEAGLAAPDDPAGFADCVEGMLDGPADLRLAARSRAEQFGWDRTVEGFLAVHRLPYGARAGAGQEGR